MAESSVFVCACQSKAGEGTRTLNIQLGRLTAHPVTLANTRTSGLGSETPSTSPSSQPQNRLFDPQLQQVIDTWQDLPDAIRKAIIAMIEATKP